MQDAGLATTEELTSAAAEATATHHRLGEVLIDRGVLDERDVYRALALLHDLPFQSSDELLPQVDPALGRAVPLRFQEFHKVIPLRLDGDALMVATSDPLILVPELGAALGAKQVRRVLVTPTDMPHLRMAITLQQVALAQGPAPTPRQAADLLIADPGRPSRRNSCSTACCSTRSRSGPATFTSRRIAGRRASGSGSTATCATSRTIA